MYKYQAVILDEQRYEAPKKYIRVITDKKLHYNDIVTGSDGEIILANRKEGTHKTMRINNNKYYFGEGEDF